MPLNAAAVFIASRPSGLAAAPATGLMLLGVGGLQLLACGAFLEPERPSLWHRGALPGALAPFLARRTLFTAAVAAAGALPSVLYALRTLSHFAEALPALLYALACIVALAFYHTALWSERVRPDAATSPLAHLVRAPKLGFLALFLASGLLADAGIAAFAPLFGFAAAFVATRWHGALQRVLYRSSSNVARPALLTATYALVTIMVTRVVQALLLRLWLQSMPAWQAATLAFVLGGGVMLAASLLWQRHRGGAALTERLGLAGGRGLGITLREALLWGGPAIAIGLGYWGAIGHRVATSVGPTAANAPMMTLLAGSAVAAVGVTCIAAPVIEELLYRGMLHRSLRGSWSMAPSLIVSAGVFALDHPWLAALPVLGMGVCATLAFERSRSLYAAVLVHALYNGALVLMQLVG